MKRVVVIVIMMLVAGIPISGFAQNTELGKKITASVKLLSSDAPKGLKQIWADLGGLSYQHSLSQDELIRKVNTRIDSIVLEDEYHLIVESLMTGFRNARKNPDVAMQLMFMVNSLGAGELNEHPDWKLEFRDYAFEHKWLTFYWYYGIDTYYDDEEKNLDRSNELFTQFGWAEETEFIGGNQDLLSLYELDPELAYYTGNRYLYDITDDSEFFTYAHFKNLKKWKTGELMRVWYIIRNSYELGMFDKAMLYANLVKNVDVDGRTEKAMHREIINNYELLKGNLFRPGDQKDTVRHNYMFGDRLAASASKDFEALIEKSNQGGLKREDIDKAAGKMDKYTKPFRKKNYIDYGFYDYDLMIATMYKSYGYTEKVNEYLNYLKEVDTLELNEFLAHDLTIVDYVDLRFNLARLYWGFDNARTEEELRKVEKIIYILDQQKPFIKFDKLDTLAMLNNLMAIHELGAPHADLKKQLQEIIKQLDGNGSKQFIDASLLFPGQIHQKMYLSVEIVRDILSLSEEASPNDNFDKYKTVGHPFIFGYNYQDFFDLLNQYHDELKNYGRLADFEPWYTTSINLSEKIKYSRALSMSEFYDDQFLISLYAEKNQLNKIRHLVAKWQTAASMRADTLSVVFAFMLAASNHQLSENLPYEVRKRNAQKYFELVKSRGNCSQCYVVSSKELFEVYLEMKDTANAKKILDDLSSKIKSNELIDLELNTMIYSIKLEYLIAVVSSKFNAGKNFKKELTEIASVCDLAQDLDPSKRDYFRLYKKWTELMAQQTVSTDETWSVFKSLHNGYLKNSYVYTDSDRKNYFKEISVYLDLLNWNLFLHPESEKITDIFDYLAYYKSFVGSSYADIKRYMQSNSDPELLQKMEMLNVIRKQTGHEREFKEYKMEKGILTDISKRQSTVEKPIYGFDQMITKLEERDRVVNFGSAINGLTGEIIYFALVAGKQMKAPQYVYLGTAEQLDQLAYKAYDVQMKSLVKPTQNDTTAYYYFWKPLEKFIPQGSRVYLMNEGIYHKVNLGTISYSGKNLCDFYRFQTILRIEEIGKSVEKLGSIRADIFGDPKFGIGYTWSNSITINELPNTESECDKISNLLTIADNSQVYVHLKSSATEDKFKAVVDPEILHVASHGFFIPQKEEVAQQKTYTGDVKFRSTGIDFQNTSDPMLRSGILFSGAQNTLNGYNIAIDAEHMEDGILTAKEALTLNLDSTKLVVLSACETGLGDIDPGQTVSGLQKSFKIAGADYLVLTLWAVDDKATAEFMIEFYRKLMDYHKTDNGIELAFFDAQKTFKSNPKYSHPFFWGAFVLLR